MTDVNLQPIRREDYTAPPFWIDEVNLTLDLDPAKTCILNRMRLRPNPVMSQPQPLRLDGTDLELSRVLINGQGTAFRIEKTARGSQLVIESAPREPFDLEIFTVCRPEKNTEYQGLYLSQDAFFTQCEAQGFRRITYFLDRPDVMTVYTVTLKADKKTYPVLLSNGNLKEQGDLEDGRHYAVWHDPFPKPSYLFAVVAGNLVCREQRIKTTNGKSHILQVYVRQGDIDKTEHAMNSLINSIAWDEARFGLPLDLERYMIVAVSDFNMGAMENKGLNIFNTKYVLANSRTATDADYLGIESVIGHEYFHNWTGNRVTCRDWFQLTLKEGLTVFRDQEFSMAMAGTPSGRAIKRIDDVRVLRSHQFPEDAGPMAHPIRPDEYVQIDNFYTATVYEKGAEVIRMMQTLVGKAGFAKGITLYFERFDGQAVTCDDFVQTIADANPDSQLAKLQTQFMCWYSQAGTPEVLAKWVHDVEQKRYKLTLSQSCSATPGQSTKEPFVIPVAIGLIDAQTGREIPLLLADEQVNDTMVATSSSRVLVLSAQEQSWMFIDVDGQPVLSALRNFSAPVKLLIDTTDEHEITLLRYDTDPFNRWEAAQRLALRRILNAVHEGTSVVLNDAYLEAMRDVLYDARMDSGFKALLFTLPNEIYIAEQLNEVDAQKIHLARESMLDELGRKLRADFITTYHANAMTQSHDLSYKTMGMRALSNLALSYICRISDQADSQVWEGKIYQRFKDAPNMTVRQGALMALQAGRSKLLPDAMAKFLQEFHEEALVVDKWFNIQATASDKDGDTLSQVRLLLKHPDFSLKNPNRVRSLVSAFCQANPAGFHRKDGAGYEFWAQQVIALNKINGQVAARLARALDGWRRLAEPYRTEAQEALQKVAKSNELKSAEVKEIIFRSLGMLESEEKINQ